MLTFVCLQMGKNWQQVSEPSERIGPDTPGRWRFYRMRLNLYDGTARSLLLFT